ncbi:MAG: 2-oxoacid:acceptor oxidoreductase family protein [Candidatus Wallbacteria bacterium]|nr:2-oxoacid:acceptor oxidoreductase family protein [Candidatus Wallbacteria bacterium]
MPERSRSKVAHPPPPPALAPVRAQHVPVEIERVILAGPRGRGIHYAGRLIAQAGLLKGRNVTWVPMFSPTVRGPTDHCTVLVSKEEIGSPLAGVPDIVLALDPADYELFKLRIKAGGLMLYDANAVDLLPESFRDDIRTIAVPARELTRELGDDSLASLLMLGAYLGNSRLLDEKSVHEALKRTPVPQEGAGWPIDLARRAVDEGFRYVRERRYMYNRYAYSIFMR